MHHSHGTRLFGEQVLWHTVAVVADDGVCHVEDIGCGTIVLVEHDVGVGMEIHKQLRTRPTPLVNGLVGVAHHAQVAQSAAQYAEQFPFVGIAVLHLVNLQIVEFRLPRLAHFGEIVENVEREIHQIIEIHGKQPKLLLQVIAEKLHIGLRLRLRMRKHKLRHIVHAHLPFGFPDMGEVLVHGRFLSVDIHRLHNALHHRLFILIVENGESFRITQAMDFLAQKFHAKAVNGAHIVGHQPRIHQPGYAVLHFLRRLVGESHTQNVARVHTKHIH